MEGKNQFTKQSSFLNELKETARTPEEVAEAEEARRRALENKKQKEDLDRFCNQVMGEIRYQAAQGKFEVVNGERVVKGHLWYPLRGSDLFDTPKKCRAISSPWHRSYEDEEWLQELHYHKVSSIRSREKWSGTLTLKPSTIENLQIAQKMLKEEGVQIKPVWIVNKLKQDNYYGSKGNIISRSKGDIISREVFYSDEITVTQSYKDYVYVQFAYEYEVKF